MGTFHSLCLSILRVDMDKLPPAYGYRRGFAVYDVRGQVSIPRPLGCAPFAFSLSTRHSPEARGSRPGTADHTIDRAWNASLPGARPWSMPWPLTKTFASEGKRFY